MTHGGRFSCQVDWLHASAESLLTLTNIVDVIGLKLTLDAALAASSGGGGGSGEQAVGGPSRPAGIGLVPVLGLALGTVAFCVGGSALGANGLAEHAPFLGGLGNLPDTFPAPGAAEPLNALSLPTWVIHVSSLLEWLAAMGLVWRIGLTTGNPRWNQLTWAMIPSHSSGVAACVFHLFYNADSLQDVVLAQAGLTLLGNLALAVAAYRLALSNGLGAWALPFTEAAPPDGALAQDLAQEGGGEAAVREGSGKVQGGGEAAVRVDPSAGSALGLAQLLALSVALSYLVKYGEPLLGGLVLEPNLGEAAALIVLATGFNVYKWAQRSGTAEDFTGLL